MAGINSNLSGQGGKNILTQDISCYILPIFIASAMTLSHQQGLSKITIIIGFLIAMGYLLYFLSGRNRLQPEVVIYFIWVLWSATGAFIVINQENFWTRYFTIFQISVMIFVVAGITAARGSINTAVVGLIIGVAIIIIQAITSGDLSIAEITDSDRQIAGMVRNANIFAYHMLMGIFAILFFWRERQKLLRSLLLYAGLALMSLAIIASGSRKNFIAEVLFFNLWIFYCYGRRIFRTRFGIIGLFIFLLSIYYFVDFTLTSTITGERLFAVQAEYNRGSGLSKRQAMYIKGFQLINENPVFGVGLDQYIIIAEDIHGYSHSDFIEVTAGTGFVGALIYYSIYFVLWRRIVWISKRIRKPLINYHIGLIKSSVIMIFLLGLGVPYYYFKITWIYLAAVVGYTWHIERKMRKVIYVNRLKRLAESRARVRLRAATSSYH